jgi:radical SAM superfamily enzyme YgiQ (UPF0313 family)
MKNGEKPNEIDVLLTTDRTLMTDHHGSEFLGFATCIPPYPLPISMSKLLFFPPIKNRQGIPRAAPYGLRKIESALLRSGLHTLVVDPDHLQRYLPTAKVLAISTMDPFGWGPASSTFRKILKKGDVFSTIFFKKLLNSHEVKKAKRGGLKILVGGPGSWEFKHAPEFMDENGIDCVINGEAETVLPDLIKEIIDIDEKDLPKFLDVPTASSPRLDEIPEIVAPSVNGLIEVGRGCPRGCKFCEVTLRKLRWYPLDKIEKELMANTKNGQLSGIIHAEDVLLYGVNGIKPDLDKLIPMFELFAKYYKKGVSWSHTSIAAISTCPEAVEKANDLFMQNTPKGWFGVEIGIETGSPELIMRSMPAKVKPFKAEEWPGLVENSLGILQDNSIVPACTLITGLPEEREEDVVKTLELLDDIKKYRALIVPLFFVPLGRLKDKDWFTAEETNDLQRELLKKCLVNGIHWAKELARGYNKGHIYSPIVNGSLLAFINLLEFIGKRKNLI